MQDSMLRFNCSIGRQHAFASAASGHETKGSNPMREQQDRLMHDPSWK